MDTNNNMTMTIIFNPAAADTSQCNWGLKYINIVSANRLQDTVLDYVNNKNINMLLSPPIMLKVYNL